MTNVQYEKDPLAVLDYGWDWGTAGWLASGETIASSTWTATAGITMQTPTNTATTTTVWLAGGTVGTPYTITNKITTSAGRTDERYFTVLVMNR